MPKKIDWTKREAYGPIRTAPNGKPYLKWPASSLSIKALSENFLLDHLKKAHDQEAAKNA